MFADPITINTNGGVHTLRRINQDKYSSEYLSRSATEEMRVRIRNTSYVDKKRGGIQVDRHNVECVRTIFPIAPSTIPTVRKTYTVIENQAGDSLAEPVYVAAGLFGFLTDTANANLLKLMNFES